MNKDASSTDPQILEGKVFAILSYLSILCIIPLVLKKDNAFVLKHGKQGLILFLGEVAIFIIHIILGLWILRLGMFVLGVLSFVGLIAALQFDGFDPDSYQFLRGKDLSSQKIQLLNILEDEEINYSLVSTIVHGINDSEVTKIVDFFFDSKASKKLTKLARNGDGGTINPKTD